MKIVFIFTFVLVCGLVLGKEKRTDLEEKRANVADLENHRPICKFIVQSLNVVLLFSLHSTVIYKITQRKPTELLGFSIQ